MGRIFGGGTNHVGKALRQFAQAQGLDRGFKSSVLFLGIGGHELRFGCLYKDKKWCASCRVIPMKEHVLPTYILIFVLRKTFLPATMRAPVSNLAKELLADPESARQLRSWANSNRDFCLISFTDENEQVKQIRATRLNTITATHGFRPVKRTMKQRIQNFFDQLLGVLINPFG
jgi:hypothetical protein